MKPMSVSQILMVSFLVVTLPAIWLASSMVGAFEDELKLHIAYFKTGEFEPIIAENNSLIKVGHFLRENNFPFTNGQLGVSHIGDHSAAPSHSLWAEGLKDAEIALIYSWALLLSLGTATYLLVARSINNSFQKLLTDIKTLQSDQSNKAIMIEGTSDIRNISASLESFRLQLHDDQKKQQAFISHISHEIKTPLTSIKEGSTLLSEDLLGPMNSEQKEVSNILLKNSIELQSAIENLLNYNSISASNNELNRVTIKLPSLVNVALERHELIVKQKNLAIELNLEEILASVDRLKVVTIFENLISNAIKHSPPNSTIELSLTTHQDSQIEFLVKDSGPGIAEDQVMTIFEPFFVGKSTGHSTLKGTGLGLSIAKQYVLEHKGEINLISNNGGAVFQVLLPSNI
jgi:two-component system sensor histidine kinase GlrK